jgi:hypothetical protein
MRVRRVRLGIDEVREGGRSVVAALADVMRVGPAQRRGDRLAGFGHALTDLPLITDTVSCVTAPFTVSPRGYGCDRGAGRRCRRGVPIRRI